MSGARHRIAAARAVGRVVREGAWSNVVVRTESRSAGADLGIVQGLVFAVLRHLPLIDGVIGRGAGRALDSIDAVVLDVLRVSVAELIDGRKPAAVAVDGGVRAIGEVAPKARGFGNAVLRRAAEEAPAATSLGDIGVPAFVDVALRHVMEPDDVDAFWWASQESPPIGIRATHAPVSGEAVAGIPDAWLWRAGEPPRDASVQDPASVAVGNLVGAQPGWTVLDLAAAPGGKTAHLVEAVGDTGMVVGVDRHRRRTRDAAIRVPRAHWVIADSTSAPFVESWFDAVLVDAPCSGLGTLRRRPEVRMRVTPESVTAMALTQRAILDEALRLVKPGGRVVYSVCTVTPAETIDVVAGLGARLPEGLPGRPFGDGWLMAPHLGPTDGMFVAIFDR